MREHACEERANAAPERGVAARELMLFGKGPEGACAFAAVLVHVGESDHGISVGLYLLLEGGPCRLALFPVSTAHGLYVLRGSIVEVHGIAFCRGLGLYLAKDFRLGLGLVRLPGFVVLLPELCEFVSVVVHCKQVKCRKRSCKCYYQSFHNASATTKVLPPI